MEMAEKEGASEWEKKAKNKSLMFNPAASSPCSSWCSFWRQKKKKLDVSANWAKSERERNKQESVKSNGKEEEEKKRRNKDLEESH